MKRGGRLPYRSRKTAAAYVQRRRLVAELLETHPICQRCCAHPSEEVHELLSRARGGSVLARENCVALCSPCHRWITTHPKDATAEGWLRNSWEESA